MNACPVCRYHSGPLSDRQRLCPYLHVYKPRPPRNQAADDEAAAMDELGAYQYDTERDRP